MKVFAFLSGVVVGVAAVYVVGEVSRWVQWAQNHG
jgi:hypothetical protein